MRRLITGPERDARPDGIEMCQSDVGERHLKEKASMDEVTIVGLDRSGSATHTA